MRYILALQVIELFFFIKKGCFFLLQTNKHEKQSAVQGRPVPCDHWQYDESESRSTIVAEWDLVCQRSRLKHLIWATFMTGGAVAVPTLGLTADVVGRRPVLIAAVLLLLLSGLGVCLCESLLWFTVLRFMSGASTGALDVISTVLLFESTPAGPRGAFVAASVSLATCLSPVFVATVSAVFATWRMLHVVLLVPALLLACLVFTIEESPHWCLYNNKFDDAERVALWAARLNLEDPDLVRDRLERIRKEAEFLGEEAVLRYPRLLRYIASAPVRSRCFALFGCWCFVYIAFYARDYWKLGPWIQTAQWFVVTVNFPAMAAAYALTRRHGGLHCAVPLLATCSMMSALQSALVAVGGQSSLLLVYCSSVIILNVTYVTLVVHTVDAFPTPARSLGYSGAFMFGRMGAMMGTLFREFESMPLPVNVLPTAVTSLGLVAFAASLLLVPPSTKGLFAADGSAFLRDKPGEVVLPVESPTLSWKVHKRMSPLQSPSCERE
ncbi:organic cation transporter protein [Rhipicephalus microplus]|uniref:organic cation transporter protein n=1 Tax=Rhipicephalus microplus TaxID=6941 RepID=UPI003F6D1722